MHAALMGVQSVDEGLCHISMSINVNEIDGRSCGIPRTDRLGLYRRRLPVAGAQSATVGPLGHVDADAVREGSTGTHQGFCHSAEEPPNT